MNKLTQSLRDLERNLGLITELRNEATCGGFRRVSVFDDEVWGLATLAVNGDQGSFDTEMSRVRERLA